MTVLSATDLRQSYGTRQVLDGASLTLDMGERVGLVGANGSGKSTLARILAGVEEPDGGKVVLRRGVEVGYLPQQPNFEGDPTALDAALSGLAGWKAACERHEKASEALSSGVGDIERWLERQALAAADVDRLGGWTRAHDAAAMLDRLGVGALKERNISKLSGGERRRVDLARLLVSRPELAILDEPTNHLDLETIEWLENHLCTEQPGAILLITHDRYFLDRVVSRTAELSLGSLRIYEGGYRAFLEAKATREAHEARVERNRQNFIRRELEWLRRGPPARTTKQKARIDRANAVLSESGPARAKDLSLTTEVVRSGRTILNIEDLCLKIPGRTLIESLTLSLTKGERIGIVGANGAGKTTLLRAILSEVTPDGGEITLGKNAHVTYLGQKREGLDEDETVFENVAGGRSRVTLGDQTMDTRGYLERFLFDNAQQRQKVSVLSGGEKARVLLAKLLLTPTNLLILDEPTNDLDVMSLGALEEMLVDLEGTALVVTHDRFFLDRIATSILAFEGDGKLVRYAGNYADYRETRARLKKIEAQESSSKGSKRSAKSTSGTMDASQPAPTPEKVVAAARPAARPAAKPAAKPAKAGKKLTYGEELELSGIMEKIEAAEEKAEELEAKLADPSVYEGTGEKGKKLAAALSAAQSEAETLVMRWEALEEKKGG